MMMMKRAEPQIYPSIPSVNHVTPYRVSLIQRLTSPAPRAPEPQWYASIPSALRTRVLAVRPPVFASTLFLLSSASGLAGQKFQPLRSSPGHLLTTGTGAAFLPEPEEKMTPRWCVGSLLLRRKTDETGRTITGFV